MKNARPNGMTPLHDVALASRVALAAAVLGSCVLLAACGSVAAPGSGDGGSSSAAFTPSTSTSGGATPAAAANSSVPTSQAAVANAQVSLDVTFVATSTSPARHYTLSCEPAGGTTPDPAAACSKLLAGDNIFAPRPMHIACPMVLQGTGRALITGSYFGRAVHMTIVNGGCDLPTWAKLKAIFG